jgi:hypothetical protein
VDVDDHEDYLMQSDQTNYDSGSLAGVHREVQAENDQMPEELNTTEVEEDDDEEDKQTSESKGASDTTSLHKNTEVEDDDDEEDKQAAASNESSDDESLDDITGVAKANSPERRRSTRSNKGIPPTRLSLYQSGDSVAQEKCYEDDEAEIMGKIMSQLNEATHVEHVGAQFATTYSLKQGIKKFGVRGRKAAIAEMQQLHDRKCFRPMSKHEITNIDHSRVLESLIFLTEKRNKTIKARHCANGSKQRDYMSKEDVSSPTVSTEATLITATIEAEEGRDVATCDIPNAFIQTELNDETEGKTIMKIRGTLVEILCTLDEEYENCVIMEGKNRVLYVQVLKAIYGLLVSAMLFYKKLSTDLKSIGFEINPYDPCVANRMMKGKQQTVCWHIDDLKSSHEDPTVNDEFLKWIKEKYGKIGEVKVTRGKLHDYLGMTLDYKTKGEVSIDMTQYVQAMVDNFPEQLSGKEIVSPWNENLFKVKDSSPPLSKEMAEKFHTITAQGLFLCKRGRPDIALAIAYLTTRVRNPDEDDWAKLTRMVQYLKQTATDRLTLRSDGTGVLKWHGDAAFAVHGDYRSHTGGTFTMGQGAITTISRKQGLNTRSSTEAEIVAADDLVAPMVWTRSFMEAQQYKVVENVLYQDNQSAIKLEKNGRKSVGKRSRHLNIRLFYITDMSENGSITIKFCPTEAMTADYCTKPLHGKKFRQFRSEILNCSAGRQECVGNSAPAPRD